LAITTINAMVQGIPEEWVKQNAAIADGFTAMPLEVLVRFGRWSEVMAAPEPPEYLPLARCMRYCARGIACAAMGQLPQAREEQQAFLRAKSQIAPEAAFGNNKALDLMAVAEHLLAGEILYRSGNVEGGIASLREAVRREDQLRYDEPPDWIHPVRHALGAALLQAQQFSEAEQVYRQDLAKLPDNGWALFGLARSLRLQGQAEAAQQFEARFRQVWTDADITITSSCFCQPGR
jgi:tetratricopeptide (TPR) repeat protein